jgi:phosphoserine phosphatase
VVSAAPDEIVHAALEGIVPPSNIIGTKLTYDQHTGEIESVERVAAGYGKVAAVETLRAALSVPRERIVYVGDGTSDLHVMLHVNRGDGLTIAVSQAKHITEIAKRTVISDDALSVLVPILEDVAQYTSADIRRLFERNGLVIQECDRVRTDWLTIGVNTNTDEMPVISVAA